VPVPDVVVRCEGVSAQHRSAAGVAHALRGVDLVAPRGRLTVVAGPSGSGKSTLLRVLAGLLRPVGGRVEVAGTDLTGLGAGALRRFRRRTTGVVLQRPSDNLVEYLDAGQQLELAGRLRGTPVPDADDLLAALGLADRVHARPSELSGGEQQRVAFAAAAVGPPAVVLADEPTAQLDASSGDVLVGAMRALVDRGATLVVSSHDHHVLDAADHLVTLHDGQVVP